MTVRIPIPQLASRTTCSDYPGAIESLNSTLAISLLWNVNSNKAKSVLGLEAQPRDSRALPWLRMAPTSAQGQLPGPEDGDSDSTSGRHALKLCSYQGTDCPLDVARQPLRLWACFLMLPVQPGGLRPVHLSQV